MKTLALAVILFAGFSSHAATVSDDESIMVTNQIYKSKSGINLAKNLGDLTLDCGKILSIKVLHSSDTSANIQFKSDTMSAIEAPVELHNSSSFFYIENAFNEGQYETIVIPGEWGLIGGVEGEASAYHKGDTVSAVATEWSDGPEVYKNRKVTCTVK